MQERKVPTEGEIREQNRWDGLALIPDLQEHGGCWRLDQGRLEPCHAKPELPEVAFGCICTWINSAVLLVIQQAWRICTVCDPRLRAVPPPQHHRPLRACFSSCSVLPIPPSPRPSSKQLDRLPRAAVMQHSRCLVVKAHQREIRSQASPGGLHRNVVVSRAGDNPRRLRLRMLPHAPAPRPHRQAEAPQCMVGYPTCSHRCLEWSLKASSPWTKRRSTSRS